MKVKKKHLLNIFNSKPKKYKFYHKPRSFFKFNFNNNERYFRDHTKKTYAIVSLDSVYLTIPPLLACIKHLKKVLKIINTFSKIRIYVFPDFVITAKPREVRMGGGKGEPSHKICLIKKGAVLFSVDNLNSMNALLVMRPCKFKLPFKTNITSYNW